MKQLQKRMKVGIKRLHCIYIYSCIFPRCDCIVYKVVSFPGAIVICIIYKTSPCQVLLLIEGKANAYVFASPGCKKWDTCAPEAVLHAAGGRLTDMHGTPYEYGPSVQRRNAGGVLATARAEDHQWYVEKIPDSVLAALPTGEL